MTAVEIRDLKKEVKKYIDHADERMVKAIHAMLEADQEEDWWSEISEGEKESIKIGLRQIKEGKTIPHEEVMKKHAKWLTR